MHDRNELEFLVEMLKTNIGDAEDTEKKGKNTRSKTKSEDTMTAEDKAKLILKQHAESTRISDRKNCPNTFSSPNYITRNETTNRGGHDGRNTRRGAYGGQGGYHTQTSWSTTLSSVTS